MARKAKVFVGKTEILRFCFSYKFPDRRIVFGRMFTNYADGEKYRKSLGIYGLRMKCVSIKPVALKMHDGFRMARSRRLYMTKRRLRPLAKFALSRNRRTPPTPGDQGVG